MSAVGPGPMATAPVPSRAMRAALAAIDYYQRRVSPRLPVLCRYEPSCSEYMRLAILKYGLGRGVWRGTLRLLTCAPWSRRPHLDPP